MSGKNLKYFMRPVDDAIITAPAPASFKDEKGNVVQMEIRRLRQSEIEKINKAYTVRSVATDRRGNPLVQNGNVVWKERRDSDKITHHIVAEALVYPNLKDPELMAYYDVVDVTDMPLAVFNRPGELMEVIDTVWKAIGLRADDNAEERDSEDLETAKN